MLIPRDFPLHLMRIATNKGQCLICNEIIESQYRHDYRTCKCKNCSVDGGKDYLKRSVKSFKDFKDLSMSKTRTVEDVEAEIQDRIAANKNIWKRPSSYQDLYLEDLQKELAIYRKYLTGEVITGYFN